MLESSLLPQADPAAIAQGAPTPGKGLAMGGWEGGGGEAFVTQQSQWEGNPTFLTPPAPVGIAVERPM